MFLLRRRVFLLLAFILVITSPPTVARVTDLGDETSSEVKVLRDDTFDAHVFPTEPRSQPRAWFIFFFAPWCGHCKSLLPHFRNASDMLERSGMPRATFAVVNAVKNKALALRFRVESFPTLIYTTGNTKRWHKFHGGYSIDSFLQFAVYLQRGVSAGSFADDVSDPRRFLQVEQHVANGRVPMFVYVPATEASKVGNTKHSVGQREEHVRDAQWNIALDAAASIGNIRFGVLYGDDVPDEWADQGSSSYVAVIQAARRCQGTGPGGEVLIVHSDAYKRPQCYEGLWFEDASNNINDKSSTKDEENHKVGGGGVVQLHPMFTAFITLNGFRAVEEASPGLFSMLSGHNHHYLGLLLTDGTITQADTNMLPVLREVVQERNEAHAGSVKHEPKRRISLAHADARTHPLWRARYHIERDEIPAFIVVDPRREKVYRLRRHTPLFEEIKSALPWPIGGEQQRIITAFLDDVERGNVHGEKMSIVGDAAELLLHLPGMEFVYETLGYEDGLFITMVFGLTFFTFLLFIALVAEPCMEWRKAAKEKKD